VFQNRRLLIAHRQDEHMSGGGVDEANQEEVEEVSRNIEDPETASVYHRHRYAIARRHDRLGPLHEVYNFPLLHGEISVELLMDMVEEIYGNRTRPFRLNFAIGFILESVVGDEQPRYFHPYRNVHELTRSVHISSHADLTALRRRLERMNFQERLMARRPGSSWFVSLLTNVRFEIVKTSLKQALGCRAVRLPAFINRKNSVVDFPGSDCLCFFRCLAHYFDAGFHEVDEYALKLFSIWKGEGEDASRFEGVEDCDLDELEGLFQVNVTIFCLQPDGRAETTRASTSTHDRTMYLNAYEGHVSLVTRPEEFCCKYVCAKCSVSFPRSDAKTRHEKSCKGYPEEDEQGGSGTGSTVLDRKYVGGYFKERRGLFKRLREVLIPVDESEEEYEWFACFDVECLLKDLPQNEKANSACISEHQCVSIAVSSNVPGFQEGVCFVQPSSSKLVEEMLRYLHLVQEKASELVGIQLRGPCEKLKDKLTNSDCKKERLELRRLLSELETFIERLPVLGFNSSRYDILVLREQLLSQLNLPEDERAFVCKKETGYLCINTSHFSFLDCLLYLSPGTSLNDFLLGYASEDPDQKKFWFPYEKLRCLSDLQSRDMPVYNDYFSSLKGHNTLETERLRYEGHLESGLSRDEALAKMGLNVEPATGQQNYQSMVRLWQERGMTCLRDLLVAYNIQDVQPMITGLSKLREFYRGHGINLFKECYTVAGASRLLLFQTARREGACFSLMSKEESYLQENILEQGVTGGPSLVFCRYQEAGITHLHGTKGPKCKAIHGLDANRFFSNIIGLLRTSNIIGL